jgi:hypothetical protein
MGVSAAQLLASLAVEFEGDGFVRGRAAKKKRLEIKTAKLKT